MMGIALALMLFGGLWSAAPARAASAPAVTLRDGHITLSTQGAPLGDVLTEIGRVAGIRVSLPDDGAAGDTITIRLEGVEPDVALRRILKSRNFMLLYSRGALAEVHVYSAGPGSLHGPGDAGEDAREILRLRAESLDNPDPAKRHAAVEALAGSEHELARETLRMVLETERAPEVLQSALEVLAGMDTVPLEPVLAFVKSGRAADPDLRVQALELLTERDADDLRVTDLLRTLARVDTDTEVRESAQNLLQFFGK